MSSVLCFEYTLIIYMSNMQMKSYYMAYRWTQLCWMACMLFIWTLLDGQYTYELCSMVSTVNIWTLFYVHISPGINPGYSSSSPDPK